MSLRDFTPEELVAMHAALRRTAEGVLEPGVIQPLCYPTEDTGAFPSTSVTCEGCGAQHLTVFHACYRNGEVLCPACYATRTHDGPEQAREAKTSTHPLDRWMR